jgi:hypothetical protein
MSSLKETVLNAIFFEITIKYGRKEDGEETKKKYTWQSRSQ